MELVGKGGAVFVAVQEVSLAQLFPICRLDTLPLPYFLSSCLQMRGGVRLGCACVCEIKSRKICVFVETKETLLETQIPVDIQMSDRA